MSSERAQPKKITFRFCRECSNLLYPKEDKENQRLMYQCRTCETMEEASSSCVYRNELNTTVGETAGITQDVAQDPTVSHGNFSPPPSPFEYDEEMEDFEMEMVDDMEGIEGELPQLCTLCGQKIICETCGLETDAGVLLESVDYAESDAEVMRTLAPRKDRDSQAQLTQQMSSLMSSNTRDAERGSGEGGKH